MSHSQALTAAKRHAGLAKSGPLVTLDSASGQSMTVNANLLGTYRKLRRKGVKHRQALALAKRATLTKAAGPASFRRCALCGKPIPRDRRFCSPEHRAIAMQANTALAKASAWNPAAHPRAKAGTAQGGQFIAGGSTSPAASKASRLMGHGGVPLTKAQIMAYQKKHGLKVDGLIGRQTAAKLLGEKAQSPGALTPAQKRALGLTKPKPAPPPVPANAPGITTHPPRKRLAKQAPYAALHPPIVHHGRINWVDKVGGLPGPIDAIARVLISKGWDESRAVATAVSQAKKQCATGLAIGGHAHLHAPARAVICAAVAEWELKKAAA